MLRSFLLLLILALPMTRLGMEALGNMAGLQVYQGTYYYLDGTKDIAVEAKGTDEFGWHYKILGRWRGGVPIEIYVLEPEIGL